MGCRRLWALVAGLPSESATWRQDAWPIEVELAATQVELTDIWGRAIFAALGGKPPGEPISVTRPGEQPKEKEPKKRGLSDPDEIRKRLAAMSGMEPEPPAKDEGGKKNGATEVALNGADKSTGKKQDADQQPQRARRKHAKDHSD